ncbi:MULTISPECIES: aldehyde dehydrogenase [unclassified Parvimonas]|uniref:aldehyde dehydrogenase n=1 Tax=unclassified Parvimonas TaxID=1151464 RepID=UPI002B47F4E9|nr:MULTISPECIES: aldehyde dehydrogenase [unclassified Parvimonas]MEB3025193.1 aldehyde dehydrogenase [Parvimonas sp. M13]MEB3089189.1 aldehyde dehydrogenase [Parvimonas sp. M20]
MELKSIVEKQKEFFKKDTTKSVEFRINILQKLEKAIRDNEKQILSALYEDLSKSEAEAYMTEIGIVYGEIHEALKNIKKWCKPKRVRGSLGTFPAKSYVYSEPYGVVLIMAPWNYPFNLSLSPLVASIASGNCTVIKCSKESKNTSKIIRDIINKTFEEEYIYCIDSELDYDEILHQRYDFIFFTGSARVGKIIMRVASENLTPVSLELGGKSPCIIDETADIKLSAKRIIWGKLLNAGQTCVSIDYIVVHKNIKEEFIKYLQEEIELRYPDAINNKSYPKIINPHHYERLLNLIKTESNVIGGKSNDNERKIEPTIFPDVYFDHEIMKDEIFGPLLPIIEYDDIDKIIDIIKEREKPLACYIFSQRKENADYIINSLSYGGGCVNDTIMQLANSHIPFGGVGNSGMGSYHGKHGFDLLSHKKGIVKNKKIFDLPFRYAPFDLKKLKIFKRMM